MISNLTQPSASPQILSGEGWKCNKNTSDPAYDRKNHSLVHPYLSYNRLCPKISRQHLKGLLNIDADNPSTPSRAFQTVESSRQPYNTNQDKTQIFGAKIYS